MLGNIRLPVVVLAQGNWKGEGDRFELTLQAQAGSRAKKFALIEALNPDWKDLYETLA